MKIYAKRLNDKEADDKLTVTTEQPECYIIRNDNLITTYKLTICANQ